MTEPPNHVHGLAEQRAKARAEGDFATADVLRQEIEDAGWLVHDAAEGYELTSRPPFKVWPTVAAIPEPSGPAASEAPEAPQARTGPPAAGQGRSVDGLARADRLGPEGRPGVERDHEAGGAESTEERGQPEGGRPHPVAGRGGTASATGGAPGSPGAAEGTRTPAGTDAAARTGEAETGSDSAVASQVLWDSSLAASRLDEAISAAATTEERPERPARQVTVALLVDGAPDEVGRCLEALVTHTDAKIIALDLGDVDGAGRVLHEFAERHPERVQAWHVAETPHWQGGAAGWGASRNKLLALDGGDVHVVMETSTVLDGDAITPLVDSLGDGVSAAGWKGVDPDESGHDWHDAGPGQVRGLLGYLLAVRRDQALAAGGFPEKARYYRNADLEFSLRLPGRAVVPDAELPVHQERHRAYHDADPGYRDRESRRTYDRVLDLLRSADGG
ncbi:glycosyltransferase family A protein [Sphaerisporangium rufum]|uniref:glycosyltransferase family A protein n=1 Tax=Sphaerisporangium rufum TaxID=1381558 RepID=UPI00195217CD|nr:glycosyltransferase family A protein [Sphaerisporangium rufum]